MRTAILLLFSLCVFNLYAQTGSVKGGVLDAIFECGVVGAKVSLCRVDSSLLDTTSTKLHYGQRAIVVNGKTFYGEDAFPEEPADFNFERVQAGTYLLKVEKAGYETHWSRILVVYNSRSNTFICNDIQLFKEAKRLGEATVTASRLLMVHKGDTIVYDALALQTFEGDMLGNLIDKLPGTTIDEAGRIFVNGRFVESMLINGKDLFNGDINQALSSLPAYTVSKVKAYEKEGEMSKTTGTDMHDKTYVMDVRLKREYRKTWIGTLSAKVGLENRYRLMGNIIQMNDRQMLNIVGDMNNLNIIGTAFSNGVNNRTDDEGINYNRSVSFNYHLEPNRKFVFGISGNVRNTREYNYSTMSVENFIAEGNLYKRGSSASKSLSTLLTMATNFSWRPAKGWYLACNYQFFNQVNHFNIINRQAFYRFSPDNIFQNNALDSTFLLPSSNEMLKTYVQSRMLQEEKGKGTNRKNSIDVELHKAFGYNLLMIKGNILLNRRENDDVDKYKLQYPQANINDDFRHRLYNKSSRFLKGQIGAEYILKYASLEKKNGQLVMRYNFKSSHDNVDNLLYRLDWIYGEKEGENTTIDWLPSFRQALLSAMDNTNSYFSTTSESTHEVEMKWEHKFMLSNQSWMEIQANAPLIYNYDRFNYRRNFSNHIINKSAFLFNPSFLLLWKPISGDKEGSKSQIRFSYSIKGNSPAIAQLLEYVDEQDPLNVTSGNRNLKNSWTNDVWLSYKRNWKQVWTNGRIRLRTHKDAIGIQNVYNKQTGSSFSSPVNVDGNWELSIGKQAAIFLDKNQRWNVSCAINWDYNSNRDLNGWNSGENRVVNVSTVHTMSLYPDISLSFNSRKNYDVKLFLSPEWNKVASPIASFTTINAWTVRYGMSADISLPWGIQCRTIINSYSRFNYSDASMNDTRVIMNMNLTKQFKHGFSVTAEAFDLLRQNKNVSVILNEQGRTESYYQTLPPYVLIGVSWRFTKLPKSGKD